MHGNYIGEASNLTNNNTLNIKEKFVINESKYVYE